MKPENYATRTFVCDAIRADDDAQTINFSFSSETPVERFFGNEILDHSPSSVSLGRLNDGAPLLLDHRNDHESHIGTITRAYLEDGRGRAQARFADTPTARDAFGMVRDGIKRAVSVGYRIHDVILEERTDDGPDTYRVTRWTPLEVSLVTVAADPNVGVGRAESSDYPMHFIKDLEMENKTEAPTEAPKAPEIDVQEIESRAAAAARKSEQERIRSITAVAEMNAQNAAVKELAKRAIEDGMALPAFHQDVIPLLGRATPLPIDNDPATKLDMEPKQVREFSILRAVRAIVASQQEGANPMKIAPFEMECSRAIQDKLDRAPRGFFVPFDVQEGSVWSRVLNVSDDSGMVGTDHLAANFIDALRAKTVVISAGAQTLPGLVGNVDIPKFSAASAFGWLAEDGSSADTEPTTASVTLSPKTVSGSVPITRRLLKQSSPAIELLVRNDLTAGAAVAIDSGAIQGTGADGQPEGIVNVTGVNTEAIATPGQPTWADLVNFEIALATDNALAGSLRYILTPAVAGHCKTTAKDAGSGLFLMEGGSINGYTSEMTTQVPANGIIFGDFSQLLLGFWGVLDINVDVATKAATGGVVLRAFQDIDVNVRHAVSFCVNA